MIQVVKYLIILLLTVPPGKPTQHALVVGIDSYANPKIQALNGAAKDARDIYNLLTSQKGFAIPEQQVHLLLNEKATRAAFDGAIEKLTQQVQPGDVALIYFAGHGSVARDGNGDEPDHWDETLVFHDSRTHRIRDLDDDTLQHQLSPLLAKLDHLLLITDAGGGWTGRKTEKVRNIQPDRQLERLEDAQRAQDQRVPVQQIPNLVVFSAASEMEYAYETEDGGRFTQALIQSLTETRETGQTYAAVALKIRNQLDKDGTQKPYFSGNLNRSFLGEGIVGQWRITRIEGDDEVYLTGSPTPGMGLKAELSVRRVGKTSERARLLITEFKDFNARARIIEKKQPIQVGDPLTLYRTSPHANALQVRIRIRPEEGGLFQERYHTMLGNLTKLPGVTISEARGGFEVTADRGGRLQLLGPEGKIRNVFHVTPAEEGPALRRALEGHAKSHQLQRLEGPGGRSFVDGETLRVRLVPATYKKDCTPTQWQPAPANQSQKIPLCQTWNIEVTVAPHAPLPLQVGGLILSSDGSILGFPSDDETVILQPGQTYTFPNDTFIAKEPYHVPETLVAFGTRDQATINWSQLSQTSRDPGGKGLTQALFNHLKGNRNPPDQNPWTLTKIEFQTIPQK